MRKFYEVQKICFEIIKKMEKEKEQKQVPALSSRGGLGGKCTTMFTQVVTYMNLRWIKSRLGHKIWSLTHPLFMSTDVCYIDVRPRSAPALELVALPRSGEPHISRAASSVRVMYCVSGPNTGSNPRGGQILN